MHTPHLNGQDQQPISDQEFNFVTRQAWSPNGEWLIIKSAYRDEDGFLFRVKYDGSQVEQTTDGFMVKQLETWSADSEWLIFSSEHEGNLDIYRIRADGSDIQNLTNSPNNDRFEFLSPDGEWIVYTVIGDGRGEIYRMRLDGTDKQNLTNGLGGSFQTLSPDGEWIYFSSNRNSSNPDDQHWFRMSLDGSNVEQLQNDLVNYSFQEWTANGEWIIFFLKQGNSALLMRMRPDGSDARSLASIPSILLTVSPDGEWVYYEFNATDFCRRNLETLVDECFTDAPYGTITWTPDGSNMVFLDYDTLCLMSPDGSEIQLAVEAVVGKKFETWSPDGEWLITSNSNISYGLQTLYRVSISQQDSVQLTTDGWNSFLGWSLPIQQ